MCGGEPGGWWVVVVGGARLLWRSVCEKVGEPGGDVVEVNGGAFEAGQVRGEGAAAFQLGVDQCERGEDAAGGAGELVELGG